MDKQLGSQSDSQSMLPTVFFLATRIYVSSVTHRLWDSFSFPLFPSRERDSIRFDSIKFSKRSIPISRPFSLYWNL